MIRRLLLLIVGLALLQPFRVYAQAPTQPAPIWLWSDCDVPYVTISWYNPPEEVLPFTAYFPGYLTVLGDGWGETEIMTYYGSMTCPLYEGCIHYSWRAAYEIPPEEIGDYYLTAYVVNAADEVFYAQPEKFYPACNNEAALSYYLPLVSR